MEDQKKFVEMMQDLVKLAQMNKRRTSKEFVEEYFRTMNLQEQQLQYVCEYLRSQNIQVEGYEPKDQAVVDVEENHPVEESQYLGMYMDEIEQSGSRNRIEAELYARAAAGEEDAKNHIIKQKLIRVTQIAKKFQNQGISQNDLIQEGNLGLLLAVAELSLHEGMEDQFLDEQIEKSILLALDEYKADRRENRGLMRKAENLKDEMEKLEEDLGDKMTSDDVAEFTGLDLDEIQDILRMTGEDL